MNKHKPHFILCKKDVEKFLNTSLKYKEFYQRIPSGNEHFLSYLNLKTKLKKSNKFYMKWDSSYLTNKYNKLLIDIEKNMKNGYIRLYFEFLVENIKAIKVIRVYPDPSKAFFAIRNKLVFSDSIQEQLFCGLDGEVLSNLIEKISI